MFAPFPRARNDAEMTSHVTVPNHLLYISQDFPFTWIKCSGDIDNDNDSDNINQGVLIHSRLSSGFQPASWTWPISLVSSHTIAASSPLRRVEHPRPSRLAR